MARPPSVKTLVVRHAKAGNRQKWTDPDELRPLTKPGWKQAEGLVGLLSSERITRIISSSYARCVQTVEPLAKVRGLEIETDDALAEGARLPDTLRLVEHAGDGAVLCTHGDVLENLIGHLAQQGVRGADPSKGQKGSTWVLEASDGVFTKATYLPPPV